MKARTISVRDGMFAARVLEGGQGDPLLFLHGAGGLHEGSYLDLLAERFTVYAPCHPGFDGTDGLEHIEDVIDLALYYHDVMDSLGLDSAHVVGHSMGGMIAAELAALCSHRVRKLVLSNAVGFWRDEEPVLDFFTLPPDQLLQRVVHDTENEGLKELFPIPETQEERVEALFRRVQSLAAASKFMWPIPDRGLSRRIHRVRAPTLIVWGESDGLVAPSYAEDFKAAIPGSRVEIVSECGHFPMFEQRDRFVRLVTEFLSE